MSTLTAVRPAAGQRAVLPPERTDIGEQVRATTTRAAASGPALSMWPSVSSAPALRREVGDAAQAVLRGHRLADLVSREATHREIDPP